METPNSKTRHSMHSFYEKRAMFSERDDPLPSFFRKIKCNREMDAAPSFGVSMDIKCFLILTVRNKNLKILPKHFKQKLQFFNYIVAKAN